MFLLHSVAFHGDFPINSFWTVKQIEDIFYTWGQIVSKTFVARLIHSSLRLPQRVSRITPGHVQSFIGKCLALAAWRLAPSQPFTLRRRVRCPDALEGLGCCPCLGGLSRRKNRYPKLLWLSEFSFLYSLTVPEMLITLSETFRGCYSQISVSDMNCFHECLFHWPFSLFLPSCEPWMSTVLEKTQSCYSYESHCMWHHVH